MEGHAALIAWRNPARPRAPVVRDTLVKREPPPRPQFPDAAPSTVADRLLDEVRVAIGRDPDLARVAVLHLTDFLKHAAAEHARERHGLSPWRKRKIDRFLNENLEHRLRTDTLAAEVSLSVSQFGRAFKETYGTTTRRHILCLRLQLAQQLMLTTNDPLSQIALACGSSDQAHFSKVFRREIGETPSAWRRRNVADAQGRSQASSL